jgi:hypothetical protein
MKYHEDRNEYYVYLSFGGCHCGCTESEHVKISAENQEDVIRGSAKWALDYMVQGKEPFRRIGGLDEGAQSLALEVHEIKVKQGKISYDIDTLDQVSKKCRSAAEALGIEMPPHKQSLIDDNVNKITQLNAEFNLLQEEINTKLANSSELEYDCFDWED